MTHDKLPYEVRKNSNVINPNPVETIKISMTNDELLAKINPDWDEYVDNSKFRDALRAVVELTPEIDAPIESPSYLQGWNNAMKAVIQAIEKELG